MNDSIQQAGKRLIDESKRILERDVNGALEDNDFNLTVRRAQEVVELCLKGALKILGVDYSRIHDVGSLFSEQMQKKQPGVDLEILTRIEEVSLWLGQARAPALYFEREYGEEEARQAYQDAEFVFLKITKMLAPEPPEEPQKTEPDDSKE